MDDFNAVFPREVDQMPHAPIDIDLLSMPEHHEHNVGPFRIGDIPLLHSMLQYHGRVALVVLREPPSSTNFGLAKRQWTGNEVIANGYRTTEQTKYKPA